MKSSSAVITPLRGPAFDASALYMRRVQPAALASSASRLGACPRCRVRLAELLGDALGRVVEVAPAVRPADVVHDQHRQRRARAAGAPRASIRSSWYTVYQLWSPSTSATSIGGSVGEDVVAEVAVEDVPTGELPLVLGRVELGHRVDHVQLGVRPEPVEHQHRRLAAQRADLDDASDACRFEHWGDRDLPERKHDGGTGSPRGEERRR